MSFNTICIDQAPYFTSIQLASPWHPSSGLGSHQGQQVVAVVSLDFFFLGVWLSVKPSCFWRLLRVLFVGLNIYIMVMLAWGGGWGRWMCRFHRGQRMVGVGPLLPPGGFWGQNSGNQTVHQPVQQAPSPLSHLFTSLEQFPKGPGQLFRSVFLCGFTWCVSQDRTT